MSNLINSSDEWAVGTPAQRFAKDVQAEIDQRVASGMRSDYAEEISRDKIKQLRLERALQAAWSEMIEHSGREFALEALGREEEGHCPLAAELLFHMSNQVEGLGI
jgi:hypothetical protein